MYNSKLKEEFIDHYMQQRVVAETSLYSLFRKTEYFENILETDCCDFTEEDIQKMYTWFKAKSVYVLMNYNSILKAYTNWMIQNENASSNAYIAYDIRKLIPCVPDNATSIISREELDYMEKRLLNSSDRAIVECLWEGLAGRSMRDIVDIKKSDINLKTNELKLQSGKAIILTDKLLHFLLQAFDENEYACYGTTGRKKRVFGTDCLYKERDNAHAMDSDDKFFRWIYRRVTNYKNHLHYDRLTMKNIAISGMCYYLRKGMDETGLDLRSYLRTAEGTALANKYGYTSNFMVDNTYHRFKDLV